MFKADQANSAASIAQAALSKMHKKVSDPGPLFDSFSLLVSFQITTLSLFFSSIWNLF